MTKQLLTALLIAGLSATAKAEPVAYYCATTANVTVTEEGVVEHQSNPFRLLVDLAAKRVKVSRGESISWEWEDGLRNEQVGSLEYEAIGDNAFYATNEFISLVYGSGKVMISQLRSADGVRKVDAVIANCEEF